MGAQGSKQKILDCAREMFYQIGYQTTSVDDILQRCGVAKSNFYYHYRSKEELALAVLELQRLEFEHLVTDSLRRAELEPIERLRHFCNQVCHAQAELNRLGGCPLGNLAAGLANGDAHAEPFRRRLSAAFQGIEAALCACLREGVARGQIREDIPVAELAAFAVAALEGLLMLTKTHRDVSKLKSGLGAMLRIMQPVQTDNLNY